MLSVSFRREKKIMVMLDRSRALSEPVKGAFLMIAGMLAFSAMSALVRLSAEQIPSLEVAFFHNFLAVLIFMPCWRATV